MKRIVSVTAVFLCGISLLQAQPVRVSETLKELEMENISVVEKRDTITAAFETSAYRGIYNGIGIAIRHLVVIPEIPTLQLLILDNALPQLCITIPADLIQKCQSGECTLDEVYRKMGMTTSTGTAVRQLKGVKPVSYTHLDVYKRQVYTWLGESLPGRANTQKRPAFCFSRMVCAISRAI